MFEILQGDFEVGLVVVHRDTGRGRVGPPPEAGLILRPKDSS